MKRLFLLTSPHHYLRGVRCIVRPEESLGYGVRERGVASGF